MNTWTAILMMLPFVVVVIGGVLAMFNADKDATIFAFTFTAVIGGTLFLFVKGLEYFGLVKG